MGEVIDKNSFGKIRSTLKKDNKKIILCHGVFDLLHIGHIQHFHEAKSMGDILVVSVTAAKFVRKGPNRPYFDDRQRLEFLEAIEMIDYIILSESYTAEDIIPVVQPDIYVKGAEYSRAEDDITGKIMDEAALVRKYGGKICFAGGEVYSSTKLINNVMPVFSNELKEYLKAFGARHCKEEILKYADQIKNKKILVVGDAIIDEYVFCRLQGTMSKNIGYSAKFIKDERYLGGSIAIARHLAEFTRNVTLLSIMGNEPDIWELVHKECNFELDIIRTENLKTIIKKRYVESDAKRKTLDKIFAINNLPEQMEIPKNVMEKFKIELCQIIGQYDSVFLCDFGHGLIDGEIKKIIEEKASKVILNCQTNSSNYGLNLITKYKKADYFTLDEKELRLAFSDYSKQQEELLMRLAELLGGRGCLTRGSKGCLYIEGKQLCNSPAFLLDVSDTIGAGDAFYSLSGLMELVDAPMEIVAFMGNIAGALASNIIGNKEPVRKVDILKYMSTLLNF